VKLLPRSLGPGVYALLASKIPRDNGGIVIGSRGALVIDAGINGAMARQIQERVRQLTDKPLLYVVNTNYHGDHTFGNYAFPASVEIIAHRKTRDSMEDLAAEKRIRTRNLYGNDAAITDVVTWRKPDRVFDGESMELDLGDRKGSALAFRSRQHPRRHHRLRARGEGSVDGKFPVQRVNRQHHAARRRPTRVHRYPCALQEQARHQAHLSSVVVVARG